MFMGLAAFDVLARLGRLLDRRIDGGDRPMS